MIAPVKSTRITNSHGTPGWGKFGKHTGIDYGIPTGTPVYAPGAGTIRAAWFGSSGGNMLEIAIGSYWHRFLHLDRCVKRTGSVKEGELIAYSGATGAVTGPHLHWDVRKSGTAWDASYNNYINPLSLITKQGEDMPTTATDVKHIYQYGPLGRAADASGLKHYTGKTATFIINDHRASAEGKRRAAAIAKAQADAKLVPGLKAEIERLKSQPGTGDPADAVDAGKWRQLINMLPFVKK